MTLLDVQHVKKIYKTRFKGNQVEALKDIHFTVDKGDYVAIMGESGSGKSTLLNILAMLDKQNTLRSTGGRCRVSYHENGLTAGINSIEDIQERC